MGDKGNGIKLLSKAAVAMAFVPLAADIEKLGEVTDEAEAFALIDKVTDRFLEDLEEFGFILVPVKDKKEIIDNGFEMVERKRKELGLSYSEPASLDPSQPIN